MSVLTNPKHERFAQELAKGKTGDEAYVLAGYKRNKDNASRLKANESVLGRVDEILGKAAEKVGITRERILEELALIAFASLGDANVKAADKRAACMDLARIEGHVIERSEVGKPGDFSRMGDDELRNAVAQEARALLGDAAGIGASRDATPSRPAGRPH